LDSSLLLYGNQLVHLFHQSLRLDVFERNVNVPTMWNLNIHFSGRFDSYFLDLPQVHIQRNNGLKHPADSIPQGRPGLGKFLNLRTRAVFQVNLEKVRLKPNLKMRLVKHEHSRLIRQTEPSTLASAGLYLFLYTNERAHAL